MWHRRAWRRPVTAMHGQILMRDKWSANEILFVIISFVSFIHINIMGTIMTGPLVVILLIFRIIRSDLLCDLVEQIS
jgi:hypothetical protein